MLPPSPHTGRARGQSTQDHRGKQIFELLQGGGEVDFLLGINILRLSTTIFTTLTTF